MSRPKIGIALSGASGRAIAHIAVLEVLKENNIPIDILVGCSSGALIAASFAVGTMDVLKKILFEMTISKALKLWSMKKTKGAIFHLHNTEMENVLKDVTKNENFEDIGHLKLGFSATDLNTGELVIITSGSINKAFRASVAVPALLEPVVYGKRILVDGGLANVVPTHPTREMGADIVIGVNLAATKFIYEHRMPIWRGYRFITRLTGLSFIRKKIIKRPSPIQDNVDVKIPGMVSVLSKAIHHSFEIEEQWNESDISCDLMIEPDVKHYGKTEFKSLDEIYEEGRRAAEAAIPKIKKLIADFSKKPINKTQIETATVFI